MARVALPLRRTLLLGTGAIALLLAGSLAVVIAETPYDGGTEAPPVGPSAPDRPAPPPSPPRLASAIPAGQAPVAPGPAPSAPPPAAVPAPARVAHLRPPRGAPAPVEFLAGMRALEALAARCGEPGEGRSTRRPEAVFLLDVEVRSGRATVVHATVQRRGAASGAAVNCVRDLVVGQDIPLPDPGAEQAFQVPMRLRL